MQTKTQAHQWAQMTMQDVAVAGVDSVADVPVILPEGEVQSGINCRNCFAPYDPSVVDEACPAVDDAE